ncbi:hypothetical protein ACIPZ8_23620 [Pseudomonas sp. NPDC089422]|uniref:hypothetical protein n=1 Tax=Pseudomonas sp. NPDC089422 TaxID=3364466 RepID=UPI0038173852
MTRICRSPGLMSRNVSATDFRNAEQYDFGVKNHRSLGIVYQRDLEIVDNSFMRPMVDAYQPIAGLSIVARAFTDILDPVDPSKAGVNRRDTGTTHFPLEGSRPTVE